MTYRERQEAKAARLSEWAAKREQKAVSAFAVGESFRGDIAFWTQPGRVIARERVWAAHERGFEHANKAADMNGRAEGIERQLAGAIYSDDADAIEALTTRIATLETKRDAMKAENATFRKAHAAELKTLTAWGRDQVLPHASFTLTNLSADIRRNAKRLEELRKSADGTTALRLIYAHRDGDCERCGQPIVSGSVIGKYADGWSHVTVQDDRSQVRCPVA